MADKRPGAAGRVVSVGPSIRSRNVNFNEDELVNIQEVLRAKITQHNLNAPDPHVTAYVKTTHALGLIKKPQPVPYWPETETNTDAKRKYRAHIKG
jgi:hypothetical protein